MSVYRCDNPVLHKTLGLGCPCYKKHRIMSPTTGELPDNKVDGMLHQKSKFEGTRDKYQQEMMRMRGMNPRQLKELEQTQEVVNFTPDWNNWNRHIWSPSNFNGGKIGPFNMKVFYSENVSGYQISDTFLKRQPKIVTNRQGLCVSLPNKPKAGNTSFNNGGFVVLEFNPFPSSIQFAVMSPTIGQNRKDAFRIFVDDVPLNKGEYYFGDGIKHSANTFLAVKKTTDDVGHCDTLVKVVKEGKIKRLRIEFANLDQDPRGGRLALTDILIK